MNSSKSDTVKDIKLNALLEITKAINNSVPTLQLLAIYQEILEKRLSVGKLVLFSFDSEWSCILKYGVDELFNYLIFEPELLDIKEIESIAYSNGNLSKHFDIVIPVYHKKNPLAFVLLGDIDDKKLEMSSVIKHLPFIQTLTNVMIVAIENKKLFKKSIQKAAIQKELELAKGMQNLLLPSSLPNSPELEMSVLYFPHLHVGGDYYDAIWINEFECVFCVADISGKGVSAALLMSNLQAALRMLLKYNQNITDIVKDLNQLIHHNAKSEKFVSLFIAKYNTFTRQLTYINAGHNSPILYNHNTIKLLSKGCVLLGIGSLLPSVETDTVLLDKNSILFMYTDGLTDAVNSEDENIKQEDMNAIIIKNKDATCATINKVMLYFVDEFKGEISFTDDVAILTCKFK